MTQAICDALTRLAAGDAAPFRDLLAEDVTWTIRGTASWSGDYHGRTAVLRLLRGVGALIEGGWRARVEQLLALDGTVVALLRGDNQLRDGGRYDNQYCWIVRHGGGAIREIIEYGDTALLDRVLPHASSTILPVNPPA